MVVPTFQIPSRIGVIRNVVASNLLSDALPLWQQVEVRMLTRLLRYAISAAMFLVLSGNFGNAQPINVEFLQAKIAPVNGRWLSGLACRNLDRIVHVDLSINWPRDKTAAETTDLKRLVFWNKEAEFLFPDGTYSLVHGSWAVKGYFIVRSGGTHQGMVSYAFEKIDDAAVSLNQNRQETKVKSARCP
jgi:hypothetical protein